MNANANCCCGCSCGWMLYTSSVILLIRGLGTSPPEPIHGYIMARITKDAISQCRVDKRRAKLLRRLAHMPRHIGQHVTTCTRCHDSRSDGLFDKMSAEFQSFPSALGQANDRDLGNLHDIYFWCLGCRLHNLGNLSLIKAVDF